MTREAARSVAVIGPAGRRRSERSAEDCDSSAPLGTVGRSERPERPIGDAIGRARTLESLTREAESSRRGGPKHALATSDVFEVSKILVPVKEKGSYTHLTRTRSPLHRRQSLLYQPQGVNSRVWSKYIQTACQMQSGSRLNAVCMHTTLHTFFTLTYYVYAGQAISLLLLRTSPQGDTA